MGLERFLAGNSNIDKIDEGLGINTFDEVQAGMDTVLANLADDPIARQNRNQTCIKMFGKLQDNENGKRLVRRHVAKIVDRIGYVGIAAAISATILTAAAGIMYYFTSIKPCTKMLETKVEQSETVQKKLDDIKKIRNEETVYSTGAYTIFIEKDNTGVTGYRIEVKPMLSSGPKTIFGVDKNALYENKGLIETLQKAETYDKTQGRDGVLGTDTEYTPTQSVKLLNAISKNSNATNYITLAGCQKTYEITGGLKEITGGD